MFVPGTVGGDCYCSTVAHDELDSGWGYLRCGHPSEPEGVAGVPETSGVSYHYTSESTGCGAAPPACVGNSVPVAITVTPRSCPFEETFIEAIIKHGYTSTCDVKLTFAFSGNGQKGVDYRVSSDELGQCDDATCDLIIPAGEGMASMTVKMLPVPASETPKRVFVTYVDGEYADVGRQRIGVNIKKHCY
jgi:hypothetical protein